MNVKVLSKPRNQWLIGLVVGATAITGGIVFYGISQSGIISQKPAPKVETDPPVKKVTALGRLEPEAEVIKLSAPLALDGDCPRGTALRAIALLNCSSKRVNR